MRYSGLFAFIKPFSAIRDELVMSSIYVPPSVIMGIEGHLFGTATGRILRSRLSFQGVSYQKELIHTAGWNWVLGKSYERGQSILNRGILLYPELVLAFSTLDQALLAATGWVMLSRREDVLMPHSDPQSCSLSEWDALPGYECIPVALNEPGAVPMGYTLDGSPMYVRLVGQFDPVGLCVQDMNQDYSWL